MFLQRERSWGFREWLKAAPTRSFALTREERGHLAVFAVPRAVLRWPPSPLQGPLRGPRLLRTRTSVPLWQWAVFCPSRPVLSQHYLPLLFDLLGFFRISCVLMKTSFIFWYPHESILLKYLPFSGISDISGVAARSRCIGWVCSLIHTPLDAYL